CIFDIDLVRARPVGSVREEADDDVWVESIDGRVDLPLVGAESESIDGEDLGGGPSAARVADLHVQVAVAVDGYVARTSLADPRHSAGGDAPGLAFPADGLRVRGALEGGEEGGGEACRAEGSGGSRHDS